MIFVKKIIDYFTSWFILENSEKNVNSKILDCHLQLQSTDMMIIKLCNQTVSPVNISNEFEKIKWKTDTANHPLRLNSLTKLADLNLRSQSIPIVCDTFINSTSLLSLFYKWSDQKITLLISYFPKAPDNRIKKLIRY